MRHAPSSERLIREEIRRAGRITFARFMELALTTPRSGYYVAHSPVGATGDYFTAPTTHPGFGALLGLQLWDIWRRLDKPNPFNIVELGAGNGLLGTDVRAYASKLDSTFSHSIRYLNIDPSYVTPRFQDRDRSNWVRSLGVPIRRMRGVIIANELLDALPVHRFEIREKAIQEIYVTTHNNVLTEELGEPSTPELVRYLQVQGVNLPNGFRGEICLEVEGWLANVAQSLDQGAVLLIDYGHSARDLFHPLRRHGTLRCYYQHTINANPYQRVGHQDITAHVNFTHVMNIGKQQGLRNLGYTSQRSFLMNLGWNTLMDNLLRLELLREEKEANVVALRELVKPAGMGAFRVLALGSGIGASPLHGFLAKNPLLEELAHEGVALSVPLRRKEHMPLTQGWLHGETEFTLDHLWPTE